MPPFTRHLHEDDEVVARDDSNRGKPDGPANPWYSGRVLQIYEDNRTALVQFDEHFDAGGGAGACVVHEHEILFAPLRDSDWGRASGKIGGFPEDSYPVEIKPGHYIGHTEWRTDEQNKDISNALKELGFAFGGGQQTGVAGGVRYTFADGHEDWAPHLKTYLRKGMEEACFAYNLWAPDLRKDLAVHYKKDVATACGGYSGYIAFGGSLDKIRMNLTRVGMHEIAHCVGIGTHKAWRVLVDFDPDNTGAPQDPDNPLRDVDDEGMAHARGIDGLGTGVWVGRRGNEVFRKWRREKPELFVYQCLGGKSYYEKIHADGTHFWPGGLNYNTEWNSVDNLRFHVEIVDAMRRDMEEAAGEGGGGGKAIRRSFIGGGWGHFCRRFSCFGYPPSSFPGYPPSASREAEKTPNAQPLKPPSLQHAASMQLQREAQRTRGLYFTLAGEAEEIYWSKTTSAGKMKCDRCWDVYNDKEDREEYMAHRRARMLPPDYTHVDAMDEEETEAIVRNTHASDDEEKETAEEDESDEFVVAYDGPCDRVWLRNAYNAGGYGLRIAAASYGVSVRESVDVTAKVRGCVEEGFLTLGSDKAVYEVLGDPAVGRDKKFKCVFTDGVVGSPGVYILKVFDRRATEPGWLRRKGPGTAEVDIAHQGRELWVVRATWGKDEWEGGDVGGDSDEEELVENEDVTSEVRKMVVGGRLSSGGKGIGSFLRDPCVGENKVLCVKFTSL